MNLIKSHVVVKEDVKLSKAIAAEMKEDFDEVPQIIDKAKPYQNKVDAVDKEGGAASVNS